MSLCPVSAGYVADRSSDGDEDATAFLIESLSSLICPKQTSSSSYGLDPTILAITESKAWHIWIDCVVQSYQELLY